MHSTNSHTSKYERTTAAGVTVKIKYLLVAGTLLSVSAFAQTNSRPIKAESRSDTPIFRVTVISRSVTAVNYRHRSGSTKVDFSGTELMPSASGEAKVESERRSLRSGQNSANCRAQSRSEMSI